MKKHLLMLVATVVGFVGFAGSVIEWDSTKTTGNWSDGDNWFGGTAPTGLDAAKFTVPQGEEWTVTIDSDVTVTNFWIYGGGTLHLMMENAPTIMVGAENSTGSIGVGGGRFATFVTDGSSLILDGPSTFSGNGTKPTYQMLAMTDGTSLVVTNGAHFTLPGRIPSNGSGSLSTGKVSFLVSGEGSELSLSGNSSDIKGDGIIISVNDKGTIRKLPSISSSAKNFRMSVTDGAQYVDAHVFWGGTSSYLYMNNSTLAVHPTSDPSLGFCGTKSSGSGGPDAVAELDNVTVNCGTALRSSSCNQSRMIVKGGTSISAESLNWCERSGNGTDLIITNATVTISGITTIGAQQGKATQYQSKDMRIVVAKDGVFNGASLRIGQYSTNDTFFVDGGVARFSDVATVGYQLDGYSNAVVAVRGETAALTFDKTLVFNDYSGLAAELPLPSDRAVITCSDVVTINDGTKFEITVPEPVTEQTQYTILTGKSITGMIAPADVSVKGEAKATLAKSADEKSLILTLRPKSASGMIVICR